MRILEITLFGIFLLASIALVPVLIPGAELPTGNADLRFVEKMNMSELEAMKPSENAGTVDQAVFFLNYAIKGFMGAMSMLFSIVLVIPALTEVFGVDPTLVVFLSVGVFCLGVIGLIQFWKGDSFEGKR